MSTGYTAFVLGAGFGRHHARILSEIGTLQGDTLQPFDTVVLVDKDHRRAQSVAAGTSNPEIISVGVETEDDLRRLFEKYKPGFTSVATRDPELIHDVHIGHVALALAHGKVLCEKPYANPVGDGSSLVALPYHQADDFALNLPFFMVASQQGYTGIIDRLSEAENIRFAWYTNGSSEVVADTAVHPWSLLPDTFRLHSVDLVFSNGDNSVILMDYDCDGRSVAVEMDLRYNGDFTGFEIDGSTIVIRRSGVINELIDTGVSLEDAMQQGDNMEGESLLVVDNPLKMQIEAHLRGNPLVGLDRAYKSQLFLERLYGYAPVWSQDAALLSYDSLFSAGAYRDN